jgi:two-component system response regulator
VNLLAAKSMILSQEKSASIMIAVNPDDELLTLRGLKEGNITDKVIIMRDGAETLDYLFGTGAHQGRDITHMPWVILLDLKLPKINGLEVLRRVRGDSRTKLLPVIVMTSSKNEQDLIASYNWGANTYIICKPVDFSEVVTQLKLYWLLLKEQGSSTTESR